jgi:aquaporin TIP
LEGAEQGKLSTNSKLTKLILGWEHDEDSLMEHAPASISVLAKLLPPRNLQHLFLGGYMGIDFPRWMLDISSYLPHVTTIYLVGLKECNCLPPLGHLPNLRALALIAMPNIKNVGKEFYGDYGSCQKLRIIYLYSMDNLEEWWTTRSSTEEGEFLIPNLHMLFASDCPKLKFLPYPPRSMLWMLGNSNQVLPEHGFENLSSSTSPFFLVIGDTSLSADGWRRTQDLSSIQGLHFASITGLRNLPDTIRCFKSLRKLKLESHVQT